MELSISSFFIKIFSKHNYAKISSFTLQHIRTIIFLLILTSIIMTSYYAILFSSQNKRTVDFGDSFLNESLLFSHVIKSPKLVSAINLSNFSRDSITTFNPLQQLLHSTHPTDTSTSALIPLLIHQMNNEANLPAQFLFSVNAIARYHRFALDDRELSANESHNTFKYYFWSDQSIREFVADCRVSESLCEKVDPTVAGVLLSDFAYVKIIITRISYKILIYEYTFEQNYGVFYIRTSMRYFVL